MPTYLDAFFFRDIKKDMERYSMDYDTLNERTKIIEEQENIMQEYAEDNFEILEKFGAIK